MDKKWYLLLDKFRSLGGIVDNIYQRTGTNGRGLFPLDPSKKSRIFVPTHLLIKRTDVFLDEGHIRIKSDTNYSKELVSFFHDYQDNFSWGAGGKEIEEFFENGLKTFPLEVKDYLRELGIIDITKRHNVSWENFIFETYLSRRGFNYKNEQIIPPFLELVNYLPGALPLVFSAKGIEQPDVPLGEKEITHQYNFVSPLERWIQLGFTSKEPFVFSVPFNFKIKGTDFFIECKGRSLDQDDVSFIKSDYKIIIQGLPIANIYYKELPFQYILRLSNLLNINFDISEFLMEIINYNIKVRQDILPMINSIDNYASESLIEALKIELNLILEIYRANK